jgi:hypothetical protein
MQQCASPLSSVREEALRDIAHLFGLGLQTSRLDVAALRQALQAGNLGQLLLKTMTEGLARYVGSDLADDAGALSARGLSTTEVELSAFIIYTVLVLLPRTTVQALDLTSPAETAKVWGAI